MALQNIDQLLSALEASQQINFSKTSISAIGAGYFHSFYSISGVPGSGSIPPSGSLSGALCFTDLSGALKFNSASAGNTNYLARFSSIGTSAGTLILYDRLWHCASLRLSSSAFQQLGSPIISGSSGIDNRYDDGVEAWLEFYAATTTTTLSTASLFYTNYDGTQNRTGSIVLPALSYRNSQMIKFDLQAGDTGIKTVSDIRFSPLPTTLTTTNVGVTLLKRIAEISVPVNCAGQILNAFDLGLPKIEPNSSLNFTLLSTTTTTGNWIGTIDIIQG